MFCNIVIRSLNFGFSFFFFRLCVVYPFIYSVVKSFYFLYREEHIFLIFGIVVCWIPNLQFFSYFFFSSLFLQLPIYSYKNCVKRMSRGFSHSLSWTNCLILCIFLSKTVPNHIYICFQYIAQIHRNSNHLTNNKRKTVKLIVYVGELHGMQRLAQMIWINSKL